jgi:hypothetical protein
VIQSSARALTYWNALLSGVVARWLFDSNPGAVQRVPGKAIALVSAEAYAE